MRKEKDSCVRRGDSYHGACQGVAGAGHHTGHPHRPSGSPPVEPPDDAQRVLGAQT